MEEAEGKKKKAAKAKAAKAAKTKAAKGKGRCIESSSKESGGLEDDNATGEAGSGVETTSK